MTIVQSLAVFIVGFTAGVLFTIYGLYRLIVRLMAPSRSESDPDDVEDETTVAPMPAKDPYVAYGANRAH